MFCCANLPLRKKLFADTEIVVIENLMKLDTLGDGLFTFAALSLKHIDADGSPVRAIAISDQLQTL